MSSGATVNDVTLDYASLYVFIGGLVWGAGVLQGGKINLNGTLSSAVVENGGTLYVNYGGVARDVTAVQGATVTVLETVKGPSGRANTQNLVMDLGGQ